MCGGVGEFTAIFILVCKSWISAERVQYLTREWEQGYYLWDLLMQQRIALNVRVEYQLEKDIYIVGFVVGFILADSSPPPNIAWETVKHIDGDATRSSI